MSVNDVTNILYILKSNLLSITFLALAGYIWAVSSVLAPVTFLKFKHFDEKKTNFYALLAIIQLSRQKKTCDPQSCYFFDLWFAEHLFLQKLI